MERQKRREEEEDASHTVAVAVRGALRLVDSDEVDILNELHNILPPQSELYEIGPLSGAKILQRAAKRMRTSVVLYVLCRVKNIVNIADENDGKTAVFFSVAADDVKTASALIEHGAKLDVRDKIGKLPIDYSVSRRMSRFLSRKMSPLFADHDEYDSVHCDEMKRWSETVRPIEHFALVDWSLEERTRPRKRKIFGKKKDSSSSTSSTSTPVQLERVVTDHAPHVHVRCDVCRKQSEDKDDGDADRSRRMCFPPNLAFFIHEATRTELSSRERSPSWILSPEEIGLSRAESSRMGCIDVMHALHRFAARHERQRRVDLSLSLDGMWRAKTDGRIYKVRSNSQRYKARGHHIRRDVASDDCDSDEDSGDDVQTSRVGWVSPVDNELASLVVSSTDEEEEDTVAANEGRVRSIGMTRGERSLQENFTETDESDNNALLSSNDEYHSVFGRDPSTTMTGRAQEWTCWAQMRVVRKRDDNDTSRMTTTSSLEQPVRLRFHGTKYDEVICGHIGPEGDNLSSTTIRWNDGDVWSRCEPRVRMSRRLWSFWWRVRRFLRDDNDQSMIVSPSIQSFTFGDNTRNYPLLWIIANIDRDVVGPCDEREDHERSSVAATRKKNDTKNRVVTRRIERSAIVAVTRFPSMRAQIEQLVTSAFRALQSRYTPALIVRDDTTRRHGVCDNGILDFERRRIRLCLSSAMDRHVGEMRSHIYRSLLSTGLPSIPADSVQLLCEKLSPGNIVMCLQWLLCEERTLLVSSSVRTLQLAAQGLKALIFPFEWTSLHIPMLPRSLLTLTECACPFLFGILEEHLEVITRNQTPTLGIAPTPINLVFLDYDRAIPPMKSDDETVDIPADISKRAVRRIEDALRDETGVDVDAIRSSCLEMITSLFGSYDEIAMQSHRTYHTVSSALMRSNITSTRFKIYWPSDVPKLSASDVKRADNAWIERTIPPSQRQFVIRVTNGTELWQSFSTLNKECGRNDDASGDAFMNVLAHTRASAIRTFNAYAQIIRTGTDEEIISFVRSLHEKRTTKGVDQEARSENTEPQSPSLLSPPPPSLSFESRY